MRNWFIGLLSGLVLAVVLAVLLVAVAASIASGPPRVAQGSTLVLDLEDEIVEHQPSDLRARLWQGGEKTTVRNIVLNLEKAAADSRINSVVVRFNRPSLGWAKAEEIRAALERFRGSRKQLSCYMIMGSLRDYYMASACQKIAMQPLGMLDVKGMRAEALFVRGTLEKVGVEPDFVTSGPYKTAADMFTRKNMTPEHREMINWLLDGLYGDALKALAAARGKTPDEMRAIIEAGPYEPSEAKEAGLIDELLYEDQIYERIKEQDPNKRFRRLTGTRYAHVPEADAGLKTGSKIAVVYATGTIMQGEDGVDPLGGDTGTGSASMLKHLREISDDSSLKALVLRVDSPGGDAFASEAIWRAVGELQKKKPVVVSMSDVAASGGYYIAATGAPIVADAKTITGSIGVYFGKIDARGLYGKLGVTKDLITRGPNSTLDSDYTSLTPQQRQLLEKWVMDTYGVFLQRVSDARKMPVEEVNQIAQGRVWTGQQAWDRKLVDEVGGFDRAVAIAKERAKIPADERVQLVPYPRPRSLFELIMERSQGAQLGLFSGSLPPQMPPQMTETLRAFSLARLLSGRPVALMPFKLEFH